MWAEQGSRTGVQTGTTGCYGHGVKAECARGRAGVGAALGMAGIEGYEGEGRLMDVECVIQRPGSGRLLVTGTWPLYTDRSLFLSSEARGRLRVLC